LGRLIDASLMVGQSEIAERAHVALSTVQKWRRRYSDFPGPLAELACGPVFYWPDVDEWLRKTGRRSSVGQFVVLVGLGHFDIIQSFGVGG
jgi:hypothetical protein